MKVLVQSCFCAALLAALSVAAGCVAAGCESRPRASVPAAASGEKSAGVLTVFAAASLAEAFEEIGRAFEEEHAARVTLNVAGSQQLAQQFALGAPGDIFASADARQMRAVVRSGRIAEGAPRIFARNRIVVITPPDNPAGVQALEDLARPGVRLVLAAEAVPAGRYARAVLGKAAADFGADFRTRVLENAVSFEQDVRAVLAKVALGEADAGLVYATDVRRSDVRRIEIPASLNVRAAYPIAPIQGSAHAALAQAFVRFVQSCRGRRVLCRYGFRLPANATVQRNASAE